MNQIQKITIFMLTFLLQGPAIMAIGEEDVSRPVAAAFGKVGDAARDLAFGAYIKGRELLGYKTTADKARYAFDYYGREVADGLGFTSPEARFEARAGQAVERAGAGLALARDTAGDVGGRVKEGVGVLAQGVRER